MSQTNLNMNGGAGGAESRYTVTTSSNHIPQDRRRRTKNATGTYYNNSGTRDNRIGNTYRDGRFSHRGSGGSGDGPHNNGSSSYRGGSDYDSPPYQQSGLTSAVPQEGHVRSGHSSHQSQSHHYHHYQQQQQQYHHSHHHQGKNLDYESMGSTRQPRGSTMHHRTNVSQQQGDNCTGHSLPHAGFNSNPHHHQIQAGNDIVVVTSQQQEHTFPNSSGGHAHVTNASNFQVPAGPAPPTVGFIGFHPSSQPMFGTLALCHIPYGVNPSSVISPAVYTQIIGSGFVTPGLPYSNYQCGFPPVVPSHPLILQQASHPQQVQQTFHQHNAFQHQCSVPVTAVGGMQNQLQPTNGEDNLGFDSSGFLNPDADAFFPPAFPPDNDVGGEGSVPPVCNERSLETSEIKSDENVTPRNEDVNEDENDEEGKGIVKKEDDDDDED